jgi:6-pyruvoyltetrahydropterin/6-carboxytetrahydropterin synthase
VIYRVCVAFEVESGHMLSKHPGKCRFPHGHSRRVEVILASEVLDANDMVCDFKAVKLAIGEFVHSFDHAMAINSRDAMMPALEGQRLVVFQDQDPTTEVLAKRIYDHLKAEIASGRSYALTDRHGAAYSYRMPASLRVERVRVSETSSTWAEYGV